MLILARLLAGVALGLTVVPPVLFATRTLGEAAMKGAMFAGCLLWFAAAPWALKGGSH